MAVSNPFPGIEIESRVSASGTREDYFPSTDLRDWKGTFQPNKNI
jgi:hypothetical protein